MHGVCRRCPPNSLPSDSQSNFEELIGEEVGEFANALGKSPYIPLSKGDFEPAPSLERRKYLLSTLGNSQPRFGELI